MHTPASVLPLHLVNDRRITWRVFHPDEYHTHYYGQVGGMRTTSTP